MTPVYNDVVVRTLDVLLTMKEYFFPAQASAFPTGNCACFDVPLLSLY
jgi:hypothetical protein